MSTNIAALVNGREGRDINVPKASDLTINLIVIDPDTGSPHDLSTALVDVLIYDRADRKNAAIATIGAAVGTAASGKCTVVFTPANTAITPGRYYMFVRRTLASDIRWARKFTLVNIT